MDTDVSRHRSRPLADTGHVPSAPVLPTAPARTTPPFERREPLVDLMHNRPAPHQTATGRLARLIVPILLLVTVSAIAWIALRQYIYGDEPVPAPTEQVDTPVIAPEIAPEIQITPPRISVVTP